MDHKSARRISRHLAEQLTAVTKGGDVPQLGGVIHRQIEGLAGPVDGDAALWLPARPAAHWIAEAHVIGVKATAQEQPGQPRPTVNIDARPLVGEAWVVALGIDHSVSEGRDHFETTWSFGYKADTRFLVVEGQRRLIDPRFEQWADDPGEAFARSLAEKIGWPLSEPPDDE